MVEYLNNTVYCTLKPSRIHGIGVFAIRHIPKGTELTDYTVNTLDSIRVFEMQEEEFLQILPEIRNLILDRTLFASTIRFISPNADAILRSFMNHSATPNSDGIVALRDIEAGEEVTEDFHSLLTPGELTRNHMPFVWR
jgi:SET domain-containing protein